MPDDGTPCQITFTYQRREHGWDEAYISDGVREVFMGPSRVPFDPLLGLIQAVTDVLRWGGETRCLFFYEPYGDVWSFKREGDDVRVQIVRSSYGVPDQEVFAVTCNVWKFAAKVRLASGRVAASGDPNEQGGEWLGTTLEYRALCELIEDHKRRIAAQKTGG